MGLIFAYTSLFVYAAIPWLLYRRRARAEAHIATLVYAAGVCVAIGGLSIVHYGLLLATHAYRYQAVVPAEILLFVLACGIIWHLKLPSMMSSLLQDVSWPIRHDYGTTAGRRLLALFVIALIGSIGVWIWMMPRHQWDIWITWEQHARFIVRDQGLQWRTLFVATRPGDGWFRHTDYPFLWPLAISRLWLFQGGEWVWSEIGLIAIMIWGTLTAVLAGTYELCRAKRAPITAGLILLSQPVVFYWIATRYAEGPLATYMVMSAVLYCMGRRSTHAQMLLFGLSFIVAGCALWTKNEGALFFGVFSLTAIRYAPNKKRMLILGLCASPFIMTYLIHKIVIAPPGDLTIATLVENRNQLLDVGRYSLIAAYVLKHGAILMMGVLGIAIWSGANGLRKPVGPITAMALAQFGGYLCIYLLSPHPPIWHLPTSYERLWMHIVPLLVISIVSALRFAPDHAEK